MVGGQLLVKEFEAEYKAWKNGKAKGYTIDDVSAAIKDLKAK